MKRHIRHLHNMLSDFYLPKDISFQIIIYLLILKTLAESHNSNFKMLWDSLVNLKPKSEQKDYFIYRYLPFIQNDDTSFLIFKNIHSPFSYVDNFTFSEFVEIVCRCDNVDILDFIVKQTYDLKLGYLKTLDVEIQKNIIRLLDIGDYDRVLDLNLEASNLLSLLDNNSYNNTGFIQSEYSLSIRFLELLLHNNFEVQLVFHDPLIEDSPQLNNNFDIVFAIPPFGQRLLKNSDSYFPIRASLSHNLYIQKALNSLTRDGKCAIIVPDSFLNQSNIEAASMRKYILNKLVSIINLGSVFKPYLGINVSLLILKNNNFNDNILMANFQNNKIFPIEDFKEFAERFQDCGYNLHWINLNGIKNTILVSQKDIVQNNFVLDFKRYQPLEEIIKPIRNPKELIQEIQLNTDLLHNSILSIWDKFNIFQNEKNKLETCRLDNIASFKLGRPLLKDNIEYGTIPYINISDMNQCTSDYIDSSEVMISEDCVYENNLTIVGPNTILLSVRGTIGKLILTGKTVAISSALVAIEVNRYQNPYFIYQWLLNRREYLEVNTIGSVQQSLSLSFLKEIMIDLPTKKIQDKFEIYKSDLETIKQTLSNLINENQNLSKALFNQFYQEF